MEIKAKANYIKIAPRKARLIANVVRGLDVEQALNQLYATNKKASGFFITLLNSVIANAEHNFELEKGNLYIKTIFVNEGPINYRWMPKAMGRATRIRKKTSHVEIILEEKVPSTNKVKKVSKESTSEKKVKKDVETQATDDINVNEQVITEENLKAQKERTVDPRMQGKHRHQQNKDIKNKKDKGFLKQIFRRKSGS